MNIEQIAITVDAEMYEEGRFSAATAYPEEFIRRCLSKLAEQAGEPVGYEFQTEDGEWHSFINQRHYENTVADGSWPIRKLFDENQLIAAQQKAAEACAKVCEDEMDNYHYGDEGRIAAKNNAEAIRNGEWREYL